MNGVEKDNSPHGITVFRTIVQGATRRKGRGYEYTCIPVGKCNRGKMRKSLSNYFNFQLSML